LRVGNLDDKLKHIGHYRFKSPPDVLNDNNGTGTLKDFEREHILQALHDSGWVIGGPVGAAARLGMNRSTLNARMRKLKIRRPKPEYFAQSGMTM
jgi:transcriptional regulator with GAF, ATPase, and Fis domain